MLACFKDRRRVQNVTGCWRGDYFKADLRSGHTHLPSRRECDPLSVTDACSLSGPVGDEAL
jgi:hypothetical protein